MKLPITLYRLLFWYSNENFDGDHKYVKNNDSKIVTEPNKCLT